MKEKELISLIKNIVNSDYIGDDCAYLKDLGIVVTQDSLVEGVHFNTNFITPYQLGFKSVIVNLSDIYASGGEPKYITVSLSMPANTENNFVEEFYNGIKAACEDTVKVAGGDLTGADKIYISICAIGTTQKRNIASRSNAKEGYKVVVAGVHGSSAAGLRMLQNKDIKSDKSLIQAHIAPEIQGEFASKISLTVNEPYAMMDTSDGIMDALSTIAYESGILLEIDFDKIPHDKNIERFEKWEDMVLFGGEDYGIVAVIPEKYEFGGVEIGRAKSGAGVDLVYNDKTIHYSKENVENKVFNHFNY